MHAAGLSQAAESQARKMQTVSFVGSSCTPLLKARLPSPANHKPNLRPSAVVTATFAALIHGLPHPRILISSRLCGRISDPAPRDLDRTKSVVVRASAADVSGDGEATAKSGVLLQTMQLGSLFGPWYLFNIYFNIYNKQVLKVFPYPITITTLQFAVGTVFTLLLWDTSIYKLPKISSAHLFAIVPFAMVHTLGNLFTNMSLGKVVVSFTHTIKDMKPFFSVLLSALFLGEFPSIWVVSFLVPIIGGVALASMTETSFNW